MFKICPESLEPRFLQTEAYVVGPREHLTWFLSECFSYLLWVFLQCSPLDHKGIESSEKSPIKMQILLEKKSYFKLSIKWCIYMEHKLYVALDHTLWNLWWWTEYKHCPQKVCGTVRQTKICAKKSNSRHKVLHCKIKVLILIQT